MFLKADVFIILKASGRGVNYFVSKGLDSKTGWSKKIINASTFNSYFGAVSHAEEWGLNGYRIVPHRIYRTIELLEA